MTYLYVGDCTFSTTAVNRSLGQNNCSLGDNLVAPDWATGVSWWYTWTGGHGTGAEFDSYDSTNVTWSLLHNALAEATWGSWQSGVTPGHRYTWSFKNGNGAAATIRIAWYNGVYSAASDPANPNVTPASPCQYGTRKNSSAQANLYLTPALIDLILAAVAQPELAILFDALWFSTIDVEDLCGSLPPPFPVLSLDLLKANSVELQNLFKAVAWPYFCECTPGTPTPVAPPRPTGTMPPGWPTYPAFPCSDGDPCGALVAMQRQLGAMQNMLLEIKGVTVATQRYGVPFGYEHGTAHKGLAGEGTFTVDRLVGLQIIISTIPAGTKILDSQPDYVWDAGWISVSSPDGMLQQRRVARQAMTWLPPAMQDASLVGYHVTPGFTFDVVELGPEP